MVAQLSIVLVEDNDDLRELTADALREAGHRVVALSCAEELEDQAGANTPDVYLIDLNLPGESGFSLSKRIRKSQPLVGIFILSARAELDDKVAGYDCGADLYLSKPVSLPELSAALSSFARRQMARRIETQTPAGCLSLVGRDLQGSEAAVRLSVSESILLAAFARAPSSRLEIWQILELIKSDQGELNKSSLELRIVRLRKKLQQVGAPANALESIRSVGYQLNLPIQIFN
jgi:DNA-binding response OmpR family regulator